MYAQAVAITNPYLKSLRLLGVSSADDTLIHLNWRALRK